jgi:hypothetical protein
MDVQELLRKRGMDGDVDDAVQHAVLCRIECRPPRLDMELYL